MITNSQYTTLQDILDNDLEENNNSSQESDNPETVSQGNSQPATQPDVQTTTQPDVSQTTVPQNINKPIPVNPQITKTSTGQAINETPQLSKEDMDKVRKGANVMDIINLLYKQEPVDEKKLDRNRMIGEIGDSVIQLGKMLAVSKGAYIQPSDPKNSLTNYFLNEEKELRDLYKKHQDAYKQIVLNTALKEYYDNKAQEKKDAYTQALWDRQDKQFQDKQDAQAAQLKQKQEFDSSEKAKDRESREKTAANSLAERTKYHNTSNAIAQERVNKTGNGSTKVDYNDYASRAYEDKSFMDNLPDEYFDVEDVADENGNSSKSRKLKLSPTILGAMYKNYLQNKNQTPHVTQTQANYIQNIVKKYPNDDNAAIKDIAIYLQNEGYSREEAGAIIKSLQ